MNENKFKVTINGKEYEIEHYWANIVDEEGWSGTSNTYIVKYENEIVYQDIMLDDWLMEV